MEVVEAIFGKHPYVSTLTLKATETYILMIQDILRKIN